MFNYKNALEAGASEDQVIEYLAKTRKYDVQGAMSAGATKKQIIKYLSSTDKASKPAKTKPAKDDRSFGKRYVDDVKQGFSGAFNKITDMLVGTTRKTVGRLGASVYESAKELSGGEVKNRVGFDVGGRGAKPTVKDAVFLALELYPGGGFVSKYLRKIPGGNKIASAFMKMPEKLKSKAVEQYSKMLSATTKKTKTMTQRIAPELLDRGVKVKSLDSLSEKAGREISSTGDSIRKLEDTISPFAKTKTKSTVDTLKKMRQGYVVNGKVVNQQAVKAIDNELTTILQYGDEIPTKDFIRIKRILDKSVKKLNADFTKNEGMTLVAEAKEEMANAMRDRINTDHVDLAALNRDYHLWSNTKTVVDHAINRKTSQVGLSKTLSSLSGGLAGVTQGDDLGDSLQKGAIGFFLGRQAAKFFTSPAYRSVAAVNKTKLANLLANGKIKEATLLINKLVAGINNFTNNE